MELKIRQAEENEIAELLQYDRHIAVEKLMDCIRAGNVYAICLENKMIGVLRYSYFWQSIPFLDLLFLAPDCRKKGYGRHAVAYWEKQMRRMGYRNAMTSTQADETAQFFYEKLGYTRAGAFFPPEQEAEEIIFKKPLL
ncbi:MAG: GNAT family N-acetyltransferase [Clostridia bacterium]|nr:GNAT family N-acetyltransferase [Clostridia bacterium]